MDKTIEQQTRAEGGRVNAEKLLACPLCGGSAKHEHRAPGGTMSSGMEPHMQRIVCTKCGASLPWQHPKDEWGKQDKHDAALRESLVERWNTRPAPTEAEVEAAARRAAGASWLVDGPNLDRSWDMAPEAVREHFRRVARAALGVEP